MEPGGSTSAASQHGRLDRRTGPMARPTLPTWARLRPERRGPHDVSLARRPPSAGGRRLDGRSRPRARPISGGVPGRGSTDLDAGLHSERQFPPALRGIPGRSVGHVRDAGFRSERQFPPALRGIPGRSVGHVRDAGFRSERQFPPAHLGLDRLHDPRSWAASQDERGLR